MQDFSVFADRERKGWANPEIANGYVGKFGPVVDVAAQNLVEAMAGTQDVLDLCCGQGTLTGGLVAQDNTVTGLDFSPVMLERARTAAPGATLIEGDAQNMPFDADLFDGVTCNFGMMHIPDQPRALSEVARVLKPGGAFVMTSWVGPEASDAFRLIFATARSHLPHGISPPPAPDFFLYGREAEATEMLARSGLKVTAYEVLPLAWTFQDSGELFDVFLNGTVGARMLLLALPDEVRQTVATTIAQAVEEGFGIDGGYRVPAPVVKITATPA